MLCRVNTASYSNSSGADTRSPIRPSSPSRRQRRDAPCALRNAATITSVSSTPRTPNAYHMRYHSAIAAEIAALAGKCAVDRKAAC